MIPTNYWDALGNGHQGSFSFIGITGRRLTYVYELFSFKESDKVFHLF